MTKLDPSKQGSVNLGEFTRLISEPNPSFLDQLQRTIVGVTRDGGTVYKSHAELMSPSTTGRSSLPSGHRVVSITDAIQNNTNSLRARSGRLDAFYHGLNVPKRNLPWADDTRYITEPFDYVNPHYLTDRGRHTTVNRATSVGASPDWSIPQVMDRYRKDCKDDFQRTLAQRRSQLVDGAAKHRENAYEALDLRRVAYRSANIADYHERDNGRVCHVVYVSYRATSLPYCAYGLAVITPILTLVI